MPDRTTPPTERTPTETGALSAEHRQRLTTAPARRALARRDITTVYRLLADAGITQQRIASLTGQLPSEVSEILKDVHAPGAALAGR